MSIVLDGTLGITSPAETVQGALTTTGNTILGDATTDTLTVGVTGIVKDASGNVGIGTSTIVRRLDVSTSSSEFARFVGINKTIDGTGNVQIFTSNSQAADLGGSLAFGGVNGTAGAYDPWSFATLKGAKENSTSGNLSGYFAIATAASGGAITEQARIDSAGLFKFNSGYGSVATAYGCRAWVNFNGTGTVAIRASGNVSSITDNGTGDYTVNFTTAMVDANYSFSVNAGAPGIDTPFVEAPRTALTTSAFRMRTFGYNGLTIIDSSICSVSIFR